MQHGAPVVPSLLFINIDFLAEIGEKIDCIYENENKYDYIVQFYRHMSRTFQRHVKDMSKTFQKKRQKNHQKARQAFL